MKTVLYTHDFEPITVLTLDRMAVEYIEKYGGVNIPVSSLGLAWSADPICAPEHHYVRITGEMFKKGKARSLLLFTEDEESALLLKAAFLPGQTAELKDMQKRAFVAGFFRAFLPHDRPD